MSAGDDIRDGLNAAIDGLSKVADASLRAQGEQEDLRERLARLEQLLIDNGAELRALRQDVRDLRGAR